MEFSAQKLCGTVLTIKLPSSIVKVRSKNGCSISLTSNFRKCHENSKKSWES